MIEYFDIVVTVKDLRDFLENFKDSDEVWIETSPGLSNRVTCLSSLGLDAIILESNIFKDAKKTNSIDIEGVNTGKGVAP